LPNVNAPRVFSPITTTFSRRDARMTNPSPAEATRSLVMITMVVRLGMMVGSGYRVGVQISNALSLQIAASRS